MCCDGGTRMLNRDEVHETNLVWLILEYEGMFSADEIHGSKWFLFIYLSFVCVFFSFQNFEFMGKMRKSQQEKKHIKKIRRNKIEKKLKK